MIPYHRIPFADIGLFSIPLSPFMNMVGFLVGSFLAIRISKRFNANKKDVIIILLLIAIFGFGIGPRIFYYFGPWGIGLSIGEKIISIFNFTKPGMSIYGGIIFSILSIFAYTKLTKIDYRKYLLNYLNLFSIAAPLGIFFGRLGCFFYGCCFGKKAEFIFSITNLEAQTSRFPTQILLSFAALLIFIVVYIRSHKDTNVFPLCLILYSFSIFLIDFLREYPWHYLGLSFTQWVSIIILIFGIILQSWINKKIN